MRRDEGQQLIMIIMYAHNDKHHAKPDEDSASKACRMLGPPRTSVQWVCVLKFSIVCLVKITVLQLSVNFTPGIPCAGLSTQRWTFCLRRLASSA